MPFDAIFPEAQGYYLSPLRGYKERNFKTCTSG